MEIEGLEPGTSSSGGLLLDHLSHNGCCKEEECLRHIPNLPPHIRVHVVIYLVQLSIAHGQIDQNKHENQSC